MSREGIQPIRITDNETGKVYTLEFNRKTVERMERGGFIVSEASSKPLTGVATLFHGAFYKNHPGITREQTDKMLYDISSSDKLRLFDRLAALYNEPINALLGGDEDDAVEGKNAKFTVEM